MSRYYRDRVALVTGAASGIGLALSRALSAAGAIVVLTDRDLEGARAAAADLARAEGAALDVTDADAFRALVADVEARHGAVDFLFNNAGVGLAGEVRDLSVADWRPVMEVNVFGVIHGVAAVYPGMIARGFGHIVNIASGAGLCPRPGMTAYAASKHAVVGLSTSLRLEAEPYGVRVSTVCPGYIETNIQNSTRFVKLDREGLTASIPIKPMSAEDCATRVLKAAEKNQAVIPVQFVAWIDWWLWRLSPRLSLFISRYRAAQFRKHRSDQPAR